MAASVDPSAALAAGSRSGPFFEATLEPKADDWQSFRELTDPLGAARPAQIEQARHVLSTDGRADPITQQRVATSLWFMGWAARICSPWLGAALHGVVPIVDLDDLLWRPSPGQPRPLALRRPRGVAVDPRDPAAVARRLERHCVQALIEPLLASVVAAHHGSHHEVSDQVLWGNVASAWAGAATLIGRTDRQLGEWAQAIVLHLFEEEPLRGRGRYLDSDPGSTAPATFRRNSCCLLYRVVASGWCGDCVLLDRPVGGEPATTGDEG